MTDDEQPSTPCPKGVSTIPVTPGSSNSSSPQKISVTRHHVDVNSKAALLACYAALGPKPQRGAVQSLCKLYGVKRNYAAKLYKRHLRAKERGEVLDLKRMTSPRPRPVMTEEMDQMLLEFARTELWEFTLADAARFLLVSVWSIRTALKRLNWRSSRLGVRPMLTEKHMSDRLQFAMDHRREDFSAWVDIDEKWFYTIRLGTRLRIAPGEETPTPRVQNRRFIPKVMVLVAVARPRPEYGFNGIVGFWRVGELVEAKRTSKNRVKGTQVFKDLNMDSKLFAQMLRRLVFPAVRSKMPWAKTITVQMDNAPGHASAATQETLNEYLTTTNAMYPQKIRLIYQPAQSPDINVLDNSLFPSLSRRVQKQNKGNGVYDRDALWSSIATVVKKYPPETVNRAFDTKMLTLKSIKDCKGDNTYTKPHSKK